METSENTQDSSLSFSTTSYTYELDLVQDDFTFRLPWFSLPLRILKTALLMTQTAGVTSLRVSWESLTFLVFYLWFIQRRAVAFVYFLEDLKDTLVKVLMWRRGLLFRPTTHGGVLVLASIAFVVGTLFTSSVATQDFSRDQVLVAANTTETLIPEGRPRSEVVKYKVQSGDTVSKVASIYQVNVDTIKWANNLSSVDEIKPGDTLAVPPVSGIVHKVKKGETLASLTKKYKADAQTVATYPFNYIDDTLKLRVGQTLFLPGGKPPPPTPLPTAPSGPRNYPIFYAGGSGLFAWPVAGSLNQSPSWWHPAIDIGAPYGTPVKAAMTGTATTAGFNGYGFGNYIVIDHGNGYTSAYAHLASLNVRAGQSVGKGQLIGSVGCTGFCTGPHLHLEIKRSGSFVNPLSVLP